MFIGVIGYGVVGSATAEVLRRLGQVVAVTDADPAKVDLAQAEGHERLLSGSKLDILFLCVPEGQVRRALAQAPECRVTVLRSTVPPGTTDALSDEFKRELAFMPEFLRESTALWDAMNPAQIVIGTRREEHGQALSRLFAPLNAPTLVVPPSVAEMTKLTLNAYLHTLVSFWNEIAEISRRAGVESHVVGKLCAIDPRVSSYGASLHGKPVGGRCLPKDLRQLVAFARERGHAPALLEAVEWSNARARIDESARASARIAVEAEGRASRRRIGSGNGRTRSKGLGE